jgi:hypothetical protein
MIAAMILSLHHWPDCGLHGCRESTLEHADIAHGRYPAVRSCARILPRRGIPLHSHLRRTYPAIGVEMAAIFLIITSALWNLIFAVYESVTTIRTISHSHRNNSAFTDTATGRASFCPQ